MSLLTWDPFIELRNLQQGIQQFSNNAVTKEAISYRPKVEMYTDSNYAYVNVEMPGFSLDDISIEVGVKSVSIQAEKKQQTSDSGYSEFNYGRYYRVTALPVKVVSNEATAKYVDGVLRIQIPKQATQEVEVYKLKPT